MRDTLLLVLAALKEFWRTVKLGLVQDEPIAMQCAADREERERRERSERAWCAVKASYTKAPTALWSNAFQHPHHHIVYRYPSMDAFHADVRNLVVSRRAGARGESDG